MNRLYHTIKGELIPDLLKRSQEIERKWMLPNSFYEDSIMLGPKPNNDATKNEKCTGITLKNIDTNILNKLLGN
jgi:hypothetical protein